MLRLAIVLIILFANSIANAVTSTEPQKWECAINLHQGDTGALSLERTGDNVEGMIRLTRNESVFESNVSGNWANSDINLKRLLDANSSEPMAGIVITLGTKKIKMGGRFSTDYQGVWSAECDLVSESITAQSDEDANSQPELQPSTSSRVSPNNPSNKDRIKLSAVASHPDGIKSLAFFLGDEKIHSCDSRQCDISYGPLSKGSYTWRVEAISTSGAKSLGVPNNLVVRDNEVADKCTISGTATGFSADQSALYLINLYGPGNKNIFREAAGFKNSRYEFFDLPTGSYTLTVDTQADEGVLSTPSTIDVNCQSQSNLTQDFNFH